VEYPEVPTTVDFIGIVSKPDPVIVTAGNIETGKSSVEVKWYDGSIAKSTNNPWPTGDDPETETEKSYWVSQTVEGCESEKAEQKIQIVNCPWAAPTVDVSTVCQDVATIPAMTAEQQSGVTVDKWVWTKGGSDLNNNNSEYTQPTNNVKGITEYKVSYWATEPISGTSCQSPASTVTTTVYGLPEITFEKNTGDVCYTDGSVQIALTATPGDDGNGVSNGRGSGVWTSDNNAVSSSNVFDTKANGEQTGTYNLKYTYTDGQGCVNENMRTITVTYLPKPETEGFYAMTTQVNPVTVRVTSSRENGAVIKWYANENAMTTSLGEGERWETGDATDMIWDKKYYARQYSAAGGCFSEPTEAIVKIVPCPIPQVTIDDEKSCDYEEVPTLTATTGDWTERDGGKSWFRFYASADATQPEGKSQEGTYKPNKGEGVYKYYVSEFNTEPLQLLTNPEGCEGPKKEVKLTIIATPAPTITSSVDNVCEGEDNPTFTAIKGEGTIGWYEEFPGDNGVPGTIMMGDGKTFIPNGNDANEYTIWAVAYNNDCYSPSVSATYTIKPVPDAPTTENNEVCYGNENTSIVATGEDESQINWYADATKQTPLKSNSKGYTSKEIYPGEYTYYAAQKLAGCEGKANAAVFVIKSLPGVPVVSPQKNLCEYDDAPMLEATGENVKWYASDKVTEIGEGETYQTTDMTPTRKSYYASQTVDGCEGEKVLLSYMVNKKPDSPIVTGASVCEGSTQIPSLGTNLSGDIWYADETAQTRLGTGYNFIPEASEAVGSGVHPFYVQREQNGCKSDVVMVGLNVIRKPTFFIGTDTTMCIYDTVLTIQAKNFDPEITSKSYVDWSVSGSKLTKKYVDNEDHSIQPTNMLTEAGMYKIKALYTYKYDAVSCQSDTLEMLYKLVDRARDPIVFTKVICQGEEIDQLQALGSPNVVWESLSGTLPTMSQGPKYKFDPGQVLDTGTYYFRVYDINMVDSVRGCLSYIDTVSMTVAPQAKTKLFGSDSVCVGSTEQYYTQYTAESNYMWNVTGNNLNYSKDVKSSSVRYVDWGNPGIDTITVYEQTWAGCEGFDTLIVKVASMPRAFYTWTMPGASNVIEMTDSTIQDSLWYTNIDGELVGEPIEYTMSWNFGHLGEDEYAIDTVIDYKQRNYPIREGNYIYGYNCPILTATNSFGCKDVYKECIFVNIVSSLYVSNAFSPMNPAHSVRSFQPKGYNLKTCEISVFDKWGNLLWFSDAVEDGKFVGSWDGRYEGKLMKSDVYIWKIEATFLDGQVWEGFDSGNGKKTKYGSVTLVR
jgi:hypothetical protein